MKKGSLLILIGLLATSVSCKEECPVPEIVKGVKFEIKGDFSGKLFIVYTNYTGGNKALNEISLPWSLEQTFFLGTLSPIGIGAQSSVPGKAGETAALNIFVEGSEVKSSSATSGSEGELVIPSITYSL